MGATAVAMVIWQGVGRDLNPGRSKVMRGQWVGSMSSDTHMSASYVEVAPRWSMVVRVGVGRMTVY
jgi:hypothetical protein